MVYHNSRDDKNRKFIYDSHDPLLNSNENLAELVQNILNISDTKQTGGRKTKRGRKTRRKISKRKTKRRKTKRGRKTRRKISKRKTKRR